jgi:hypothetical protein
VTPYVGVIPDYVEYLANDAEIAAVFSVPLEFFRQDPRDTPTVSITRAAAGTCPAIAWRIQDLGADGDHDRRVDQPAL